MIRFRNKRGFTLVDVMIAIAIVGIVLTPMFVLQTNVMGGVIRYSERFQRLLFAKNFIINAQEKQPLSATDYTLEKKEDRPHTMLGYSFKPVAKESSLAQPRYIYRQYVLAKNNDPQETASLVQFVYKPKREE